MAVIYVKNGDFFERNNAYGLDGATPLEAVEMLYDADDELAISHDVKGYGDNAVLVSAYGVEQMIIGD